jgi:two-component system, NarL family, invasion response regulator UvrY
MIKVYIVDDHTIVREGVKRIITDTANMEVVGESGNGIEAIEKIPETACDVVLLDINLPGADGFEVLRAIRVLRPSLPVIILSIYPEEDYALKGYKEGGAGYLTKDSLPKDLIGAIHKVVSGKRYISDSLSERLMDEILEPTTARLPHERLSRREYQVLKMIVAGKSIKGIAAGLSLAPTTVSKYRERILEKIQVKTNSELVRYAMNHHLIT